jgi:hypothetical protein
LKNNFFSKKKVEKPQSIERERGETNTVPRVDSETLSDIIENYNSHRLKQQFSEIKQ